MKTICDLELLKEMGLDLEEPSTGCCGMAGAFGFERDHYDVSIACGERLLLPTIRKQMRDTMIIADGFSCREQVRQLTDRVPLHLAQVIKMALDRGPHGPPGNYPEQDYLTREPPIPSLGKSIRWLGVGVLTVLLVTFFQIRRWQRKK